MSNFAPFKRLFQTSMESITHLLTWPLERTIEIFPRKDHRLRVVEVLTKEDPLRSLTAKISI